MTGPEYDAELEAFLKRSSPMHRRLSDIDHAEPSVEIDRLVLNRARDAIDTPEQPPYRTSRWALPVGLAAAILIASTVVLNIGHRGAKVASHASPAAEVGQPAQSAGPAPSPPPAAAANPHSSPDAWLKEINRLRSAGRVADADRELAAFRTAYPTHPAYSVAKPPAR